MVIILETTAWERVVARTVGPLHGRFFLQPLMAIALGIRDGIADAKTGAPPFLMDLVFRSESRYGRLKAALSRVLVPMLVAIVLDMVVQYMLFNRISILGALLAGICLLAIPYSIARSLSNRFMTSRIGKHGVAASAGR